MSLAPFTGSEQKEMSAKLSHLFCFNFSTQGVDSQSLNILNHVDIRNTRNQELIMRVKSDIQNPDRTFYTDLNGFQVMYDAKHPTVTKVVVILISPYGTRLFFYPASL